MKQVWNRVERWLSTHAPTTVGQLGGPASEARIREAEASMFLSRLPEALRSSWALHDRCGGLFDYYDLLSPEDAVRQWRTLTEIARDLDEDEDEDGSVTCIGPVQSSWHRPMWIPFADDRGARTLVVDLDPAEGGAVGQIVRLSYNAAGPEVIAASFEAFLARVAEEMESGRVIERDGVLVRQPDSKWTYEDVKAEVAAAAASRVSSPVQSLPTEDGSALRPGDIVTATLTRWEDNKGMWLTRGDARLNVWCDEIDWTGNVFKLDPSIARIGDELRVKVMKYRSAEGEWSWWCSLRQVHPEADPLRTPSTFAVGTEHRARVLFVDPLHLRLALLPSGMQVDVSSTRLDEYSGLRKGAEVNVVVQSFTAKHRSIGVRIV